MKKYTLIVLLTIVSILSSYGQRYAPAAPTRMVNVEMKDGTKVPYRVADVQRIYFSYDSNPLNIALPAGLQKVDLKLPSGILWANMNLGATAETEVGNLFGWGDPTGQITYPDLMYYPVLSPTSNITATSNDLAFVMWGESVPDTWRLPTEKELKELIDNCDWAYQDTPVKGYKVTSKTDATASIFLPIESYRSNGTIYTDFSGYWSGSLNTANNQTAYSLVISSTLKEMKASLRSMGLYIRPVYGKKPDDMVVTVEDPINIVKNTVTLKAIYAGETASATKMGLVISKDQTLSSVLFDIPKTVAEIASDGSATYSISSQLDYNTKYYYQAYAVLNGQKYTSAVKSFTTGSKYSANAIDLGLPSGLKWSSYNLGADNPTQVGGYFAWGDPNEVTVSQNSYPYSVPDNLMDIASTQYDVVTKTVGTGWHLPTDKDFEELRDNCTWSYMVNGNLPGWMVQGPNGNSIFIPYGGNVQADGTSYQKTVAGYYWTSNNHDGINSDYFIIGSSAKTDSHVSYGQKYLRMSIRPVYGTSSTTPVTPTDPYASKAVDLALPSGTKWSNTDLGSSSETVPGSKFAWGETSTKSTFTQANYSWYSNNSYTAPPADTVNGLVNWDAATAAWGGNWQTPTEIDFNELMESCTWQWDATKNGFRVTGTNGNSIFLAIDATGTGEFWASTVYFLDGPWKYAAAYFLYFTPNKLSTNLSYYYRYEGRRIRPVLRTN